MVLRWTASALLSIEKRMRRIIGYQQLWILEAAPGGKGGYDLWVATRETRNDPWWEPVNLGPTVNHLANDGITASCGKPLETTGLQSEPSNHHSLFFLWTIL